MDAPLYPPAAMFEQPVPAPFKVGIDTLSLADLMRWPAAWAIVLKHAPAFQMTVQAPQLKPYLGNFTIEGFIAFGVTTRAAVDAIDAEIRALPAADRPAS